MKDSWAVLEVHFSYSDPGIVDKSLRGTEHMNCNER
jgi:hypothetical protein